MSQIILIMLCCITCFFIVIAIDESGRFKAKSLSSVLLSKEDSKLFILLRNKVSYYLPRCYEFCGTEHRVVPANKIQIIRVNNMSAQSAYYKQGLWKYKVYVPVNTKVYLKDIFLDELENGEWSKDKYFLNNL